MSNGKDLLELAKKCARLSNQNEELREILRDAVKFIEREPCTCRTGPVEFRMGGITYAVGEGRSICERCRVLAEINPEPPSHIAPFPL